MDAAESIPESTAGSSARAAPVQQSQTSETASPAPTASPTPTASTGDEEAVLSEREQAVLAFERQWWKYPGKKEQAIRELFGMSATRYYQILNRLVESRAAMAADPMLIKRLRRSRANRNRTRTAKRLGIELS